MSLNLMQKGVELSRIYFVWVAFNYWFFNRFFKRILIVIKWTFTYFLHLYTFKFFAFFYFFSSSLHIYLLIRLLYCINSNNIFLNKFFALAKDWTADQRLSSRSLKRTSCCGYSVYKQIRYYKVFVLRANNEKMYFMVKNTKNI